MIGLIFTDWKFILNIILVVALVVFLFMWNPFGIFGGGLKLTSTANLVTEVREIGQLVTSEYYGEVIASIEESRLNRIEEEEISIRASQLYSNLYEAMDELNAYQNQPLNVRVADYKETEPYNGWRRVISQSVNRRNILEKLDYHQFLGDLSMDPLYGDILEYLYQERGKNKILNWSSNSRHREEALYLLYSNVKQKLNPTLDEATFIDFYYKNKEANVSRKETKKKLAMVGRGWVKAGFDFGTMDNNTFYINEDAGEVHFFGLSPVILNADINPWFIPERGIPGFEILDHNGKVDFRDAKKVKQYCIDKLILNAHRADILKNAEQNGAETLKNLFSLMSGKEIKKVFFHNDRIIQLSQEIAEDEFINYHEATLLDSQIVREWIMIDSLRDTRENSYKNQQLANHKEENLAVVLKLLQQLPFQDLPRTFSYLSKITYEIAEDSILDSLENIKLEAIRYNWPSTSHKEPEKTISPPIYWIEDSLAFTSEYNTAISYLLDRGVVAGSIEEITLLKEEFSSIFLEENWVRNYTFTQPDTVQVTLVKEAEFPKKDLLDQLFPFKYDKDSWGLMISKKNLWLDSISSGQGEIPDYNDSTVWVYDATTTPEIKRLDIPLDKLMDPHLLERFADRELVWISDKLCFIQNESSFEPLKKPKEWLLTDRQSTEMEAFYRLLLKSHATNKNRGPVVRANEWMQKKFENNKPVSEWFSELKKKLND
ncbi:MAG: hypothetical protein WD426_11895 [Anditalea sp.]